MDSGRKVGFPETWLRATALWANQLLTIRGAHRLQRKDRSRQRVGTPTCPPQTEYPQGLASSRPPDTLAGRSPRERWSCESTRRVRSSQCTRSEERRVGKEC